MSEGHQEYAEQPCNTFDEFIRKAKDSHSDPKRAWVFRGQQRACWPLRTSFERECQRFNVNNDKRPALEGEMIREFQRRSHHYTSNVPAVDLTDEWLALMQHHGAPTRLLDFTYSPYVAAYFAFEHAEPECKVAIWAVDATWFEKQLHGDLARYYHSYLKRRKGKEFDAIFRAKKPIQLVLGINPFRLNERLAYQKGAFLCPGDVTVEFMKNLSTYTTMKPECLKKCVIKYTLTTGERGEKRDEALRQLDLMNINRTTLFPGLDGFAQSFSVKMATFFRDQMEGTA